MAVWILVVQMARVHDEWPRRKSAERWGDDDEVMGATAMFGKEGAKRK